ncbi:MAG: DUF6364 family protein [Planctomycetota bacterium]
MNTKLTLNVDHEIVNNAKKFARHRRVSLSRMVANYLQGLADSEPAVGTGPLSVEVRSLKGSVKITGRKTDYRKELAKALTRKYA